MIEMKSWGSDSAVVIDLEERFRAKLLVISSAIEFTYCGPVVRFSVVSAATVDTRRLILEQIAASR